MKAFAVLLLSALLAVGLVAGAFAQSSPPAPPGSSTSNPETKADNPSDSRNDPGPAGPLHVQHPTHSRQPVGLAERPRASLTRGAARSAEDHGAGRPIRPAQRVSVDPAPLQ